MRKSYNTGFLAGEGATVRLGGPEWRVNPVKYPISSISPRRVCTALFHDGSAE